MNALFIISSVAAGVFGGVFLLVRRLKLKAAREVASQTPPAEFLESVKRAFQIVWVEQYGMDPTKAWRITWVMGDRLNCASGDGWVDSYGRCVAGLSWATTHTHSIAYRPGRPISDMAYAHELWHAVDAMNGRDDSNHTGPAWAYPDGAVVRANRALKDAGL